MVQTNRRPATFRNLGDGDLGVWVAYDDREQAKALPGSRWDPGLKCWRVDARFERDARALIDALNGTIDGELEAALRTIFRRLPSELSRATYKALAKTWHPDTDGGGPLGHPSTDPGVGESQMMLDAALAYAAAGWPVFPLRGKTPLPGSTGFKDATTDLDRVREWWTRGPSCDIGTGIPESMIVVDVDAKAEGLITLHDLEETHGVPDTLTVFTDGGRLHLYFLHPGGELRQGVGVLGAGIDTRVPGKGYTILPPSKHESGRQYEWFEESVTPGQIADCFEGESTLLSNPI